MEKLKPCPFCGCKGQTWTPLQQDWNGMWDVRCVNLNCETVVRTGKMRTKEEAIAAWNRRKGGQE